MKKLSASSYGRALELLRSQARALEVALAEVWLADGPMQPALEALRAYQNADGGFGRGLEPDIRGQASSVIATTVALERLHALCQTADCPMVEGAMCYLVSQQREPGYWPLVTEANTDGPRAPWWQTEHPAGDLDLDQATANPGAEVLRYLHVYPQYAPRALREQVQESVLDLAQSHKEIEMHGLLCYDRLLNCRACPGDFREQLIGALRPRISQAVEKDPEKWSGYGLLPTEIVQTPASPWYEDLRVAVETRLDFEVDAIERDGKVSPNFAWAEGELGEQVGREWSGVLTLAALVRLKAFGRVA